MTSLKKISNHVIKNPYPYYESSTDTEEYSNIAQEIDNAIYKKCKNSRLKIVYMHKGELKRARQHSARNYPKSKNSVHSSSLISESDEDDSDRNFALSKPPQRTLSRKLSNRNSRHMTHSKYVSLFFFLLKFILHLLCLSHTVI